MKEAERAELLLQELLAIARGRAPDDIGRIVRSKTMHGRPLVHAGTRIPLSAVYSFTDAGRSPEDILDNYPSLRIEDIEAALAHRAHSRAA
jgi:uncharacterized protein (DUF433 family)